MFQIKNFLKMLLLKKILSNKKFVFVFNFNLGYFYYIL